MQGISDALAVAHPFDSVSSSTNAQPPCSRPNGSFRESNRRRVYCHGGSHCIKIEKAFTSYGRGCGVGRGLGVGAILGVGVCLGVAVGVVVAVGVGVALDSMVRTTSFVS